MSRGLALLGLIAVAAISYLVFVEDESDAIEQIRPSTQIEEDRKLAESEIPSSEPADATASRREKVEGVTQDSQPGSDRVALTQLEGEVFAKSDLFGGDRSGVTVYCWPGWYSKAPSKVSSLDRLAGLQSTTTDAEGKFRFELFVDDTHWLFAVADGMCSDPKGMRIGTKPFVNVMLEMGRLYGTGLLIETSDPERGPVDSITARGLRVDRSAGGRTFDEGEFPHAFFPSCKAVRSWTEDSHRGAYFVRAESSVASSLLAEVRLELPGHFPLRTSVELAPVSRTAALPVQVLRMETDQLFGTVEVRVSGLPEALNQEALQAPLCTPLHWSLVASESKTKIPIAIQSLADFPVRRIRVPAGEYRLNAREHSNVAIGQSREVTLSVRANETQAVEIDLSALRFWVFQRSKELDDFRFLTPPRIRIPNHQEPSFSDWEAPTQLVVLYPHSEENPISITGNVFLDGPSGPREEGRVTYYTAGIDDD